MINGAELSEGLRNRLLSYMCSALPIGNHESQRLLGQRFFEAWQRDLFSNLIDDLALRARSFAR